MTEHYRILQRNRVQHIAEGIREHVRTIQRTLENAANDHARVEWWRVLSQAHLLARHNIVIKQEYGKAKTYNELAIAAAQQSGDRFLLAATLGHLAHYYYAWTGNTAASLEMIGQAEHYADKHPAIIGWLHLLRAANAAREGNKAAVMTSLDVALLSAHRLPWGDTYIDVIDVGFTDFSIIGAGAFAANCYRQAEQPQKAYDMLTTLDYQTLAVNRHAYAYYDTTVALFKLGELEAAEAFATKAIERTPSINSTHNLPRFIALSRQIQQNEPHNPHALAIYDCALSVLQQGGASL